MKKRSEYSAVHPIDRTIGNTFAQNRCSDVLYEAKITCCASKRVTACRYAANTLPRMSGQTDRSRAIPKQRRLSGLGAFLFVFAAFSDSKGAMIALHGNAMRLPEIL